MRMVTILRRRQALLVAFMVTVLVLAFAPSGVPAAQARSELLEYSKNGVAWSSTRPDALFDAGIVLVPGDSATETMYLRNLATETGVLELTFVNADAPDDAAGDAFGVTFETISGGNQSEVGERHLIADLAEGAVVAPKVLVDPGEVLSLTVTVDLDPEVTGRVAQSSQIRLDLGIRFADAKTVLDGDQPSTPPQVIPVVPPTDADPFVPDPSAAPPPAQPGLAHTQPPAAGPTSADSMPSGPLAVTGFTAGALGALAAALIGGGIVLLRSRRREERS
jgi:hypothetical protein